MSYKTLSDRVPSENSQNLIVSIKTVNIYTALNPFIVKHYNSFVLSLCTYYYDDMFRPYTGHHQVLVHYIRAVFTR
jgi:hypothetical protein